MTDDTLLYASGGAKALKEHIFLTHVSEVVKNENVDKRFAGRYADWLKAVRLRHNLYNDNSSSIAKSGRYEGNASVYDGELKGNASTALQNVLANIFEEKVLGKESEVKYQERLSAEDKNQVEVEKSRWCICLQHSA